MQLAISRRVSAGVPLRRARAGAVTPPSPWLRRVLGVSLRAKLIGANVAVAAAAAAALALTPHALADRRAVAILGVALVLAVLVSTLLVTLATRPIREIDEVAARVWRGDFAARVRPSITADADTSRLGRTINLLLDGLQQDRVQLRALAAQTIRAQDEERSRIARELHDSVAQSIAALGYQLAALSGQTTDEALARQLVELRGFTGEILEEVRALSHVVHPRVLEDLGLVPAIEWLSRTVSERAGVRVTVRSAADVADGVTSETASALYRVAQESLRNVERHAHATSAELSLARDGDALVLEVTDDGRGFSLPDAQARRPGMGLFAMRERLALVDGRLDIESEPGRGTRVRALAPLAQRS